MPNTALKKFFWYAGLFLLAAAALLFAFQQGGVVNIENFLSGESAVHSIVRLAVMGCVFAAIGSWES